METRVIAPVQGSDTISHPQIVLSNGKTVAHSSRLSDGRLVGRFSKVSGIKDLARVGLADKYYAVTLYYALSPDRLSMILDKDSIRYVEASRKVPVFVRISSKVLGDTARYTLILSSGLPEAILRFANEPKSPHCISVINNAPLAKALRDKAAAMPGLRDYVKISAIRVVAF